MNRLQDLDWRFLGALAAMVLVVVLVLKFGR